MVVTSEISSKLTATGLLLEESLREWKQGKVSESLFRALDMKFPCNSTCPYGLLKALSWKLHEDNLEIGILSYQIDESKMIIEADPVVLYDGNSCEIHYTGATKLTIEPSNYHSKIRSARIIQEGLATFGDETCPKAGENPWNRQVCEKGPPAPQMKHVGLTNAVYCRGHKISINGKHEVECPKFVFELSVHTSFTTDSFQYKATETDINLHKKHMMLSQQDIHLNYMYGVNPYEIHDF